MFDLKKILLFVSIPVLIFQTPVLAFDYSELGDFSERSQIMQHLYGKNGREAINQEQKDLLQSKKLAPTTKCLFDQIKKNNYENAQLLLDSKVSPNESYYSEYPIYYAAKLNRSEIAKLLLEYGAKLDRGFYSELYEAVKNKNTELAQIFIEKGARINYQDSITGNTILYYALKNNMLDIAQQLIQKGARPDKKSVQIIKKKKLFNLIEN